MTRFTAPVALLALLFLYGAPARAASFDGAQLGLTWGIPFAGILLSIALLPLLAPSFWHHHFGKVSAAWALGFLVPFALLYGPTETLHQAAHTLLLEYLPFIIVLFESKGIKGARLICSHDIREIRSGTPSRWMRLRRGMRAYYQIIRAWPLMPFISVIGVGSLYVRRI